MGGMARSRRSGKRPFGSRSETYPEGVTLAVVRAGDYLPDDPTHTQSNRGLRSFSPSVLFAS